jgi:hypothetical protein
MNVPDSAAIGVNGIWVAFRVKDPNRSAFRASAKISAGWSDQNQKDHADASGLFQESAPSV